jgi:hypothetical protein
MRPVRSWRSGLPKREVKGDPRTHYHAFKEFVQYELLCGGPDPHMKLAQSIAGQLSADPVTRAWFIGCYIGPYNVPTGEAIFAEWPRPMAVLWGPTGFEEWVKEHWHDLVLRRERRPVRSSRKFVEHMLDYADWLVRPGGFEALARSESFEESFEIVRQVRYNGRYATMKLYEALRRTCGLPKHEFTDIRPAGGWSPRLALSWLFPIYAEYLNGNDCELNLGIAQGLAGNLRDILRDEGIDLDWFNLEVMLCDYKQAYDGKQYPGRAHDSELAHLRKVQAAFPNTTFRTLDTRAMLFPNWALGEAQGWNGRRDECSAVLGTYGYTWSDMLYDYIATWGSGDFAHPVMRGGL